jgi:L-alanine-DL-glutamate epimerase-like enolase superfamily enzyme
MRVSGVSIDVLEVPLRTSLTTASADWAVVRLGLLSLRTDSGLTGLGEAALDGHSMDRPTGAGPWSDWADPSNALLRALADVDLADDSAFDERLGAIDAWPLVGRALRSAVATARVDVLARTDGRSAAAWLADGTISGTPVRFLVAPPAFDVAVNALVGIAEPEVAAAEARQLVETGFTCLKLKGGAEGPGILARRVAAVRESVGPFASLRLDLNGALDEEAATSLLGELEPYRLEYVEQPIQTAAGVEALARLRRRVATPIAADEAVTDLAAVRAIAAAGAADVIVVKPARVGGLGQAARIVDLAVATDTRVTVATLFESGVGVASALHLAAIVPGDRAHGLSTAGLLASDLLTEALSIRGGRLAVPSAPGLGVAIDPLAVERYRVGHSVRDA